MAKKNVKIDEEVYGHFLDKAKRERRSVSDQISLDLAKLAEVETIASE